MSFKVLKYRQVGGIWVPVALGASPAAPPIPARPPADAPCQDAPRTEQDQYSKPVDSDSQAASDEQQTASWDERENPMVSRYAAARWYAQLGIPVFPVHWPTPKGGCSCRKPDCQHVGKHPRTRHGFKD